MAITRGSESERREQMLYMIAYLIFALCVIAMHFLIHPGRSDDEATLEITKNHSLISWVVWRFQEWSSRFIQEGMGFLAIRHQMLWRVLDAGMWIVFPALLNELTDAKGNERHLSFFLIAIYPFADFTSAGWVCTTVTYFWPVFLGLVFFVLLKKYMCLGHLTVLEYIVMFLSLIISVNHELFAALVLMILLCLTIEHYCGEKKISPIMIICSLIAVADIIMVLVSPGNQKRAATETLAQNADFAKYSFLHKFYLGFMRLVDVLVDERNAIFTVLCVLLVIGGLVCCRKLLSTILAAVLAMVIFGFGYLLDFYQVEEVWEVDVASPGAYLPFVFGTITFAVVSILLWMILSKEDENGGTGSYNATKPEGAEDSSGRVAAMSSSRNIACLALTVFLGGLATTVAMGFSPTIYVSGRRTSTFTFFAILYTTLLVYRRLNRSEVIRVPYKTEFWMAMTVAAGGYDFWMIHALNL